MNKAGRHANGSTLVTVTLQDNAGTDNGGVNTSAAQTFRITISSINDVPVANPDGGLTTPITVEEGETINVASDLIRSNDTDIEDGIPSDDITLVTQPAHHVGLFILNTDGSFTYTHDGTETPTTDTFAYRVTDSAGANSNVTTVTITITPVNETPVAVDDDYTVNEDTRLSIPAAGVLANDTDAEDDALTVVTPTTTSSEGGTVDLEADGSFTYDPPTDFNGTDTFTYQATDANSDSNTATVTITVNPVNDAPSFTEGADVTVLEDSGAYGPTGWATDPSAGPANESAQTLSFTVAATNTALFSTQPTVNPAGELTFTPAPNANGSTTISIELVDNGGTANGGDDTSTSVELIINVTEVNDAPSFIKGANAAVAEDSGAYTEPGWATAISVGPANESGQTPSFTVTNNNNSLFSAQPAISSTGELTFTPAADAYGSAWTTVTMMDSGGTANSGDNTSPSQSFLITITPVNDQPVVELTTPLLEYVEGDGNVAIDAGPESFTVTDIDSTFLSSLTVRITAGANTGIDMLACPACDELGITAAFSLTSNRLTLSGPASPADYQTALQSVTFGNSSDTPTGADRLLTIIANDGAAASTAVTMSFPFIVTGDIVIVKDAVPNNAQDFGFTETITGGSFTLDDDADPTLSNTKIFNNVVPGGRRRLRP